MNIIYIILLSVLLSSCAPPQEAIKTTNRWSDKRSWGQTVQAIDYSGKVLFKDDPRIDDMHKSNYPELSSKYVLWRVRHDGSCWLSSALSLLLFQMIEGGPEKYADVLQQMRAFAQKQVPKASFESVEALFDIFDLIKGNLNHKFSLQLRSHENIYEAFDTGMRTLLSAYFVSQGRSFENAKRIEQPKSWGTVNEFQDFFRSFGIENPFIELLGHRDLSDAMIDPHNLESLPKMLVIHGRASFIDVLVDKEISDAINAGL